MCPLKRVRGSVATVAFHMPFLQFPVGATRPMVLCSEKESHLSVSGPGPLVDLFYTCILRSWVKAGHSGQVTDLLEQRLSFNW